MTKIDIYSGFLGAGKTTLIKKMIAEAYCGQKLVLIENEFGEIGIDGGFLQDAGISITEMNSGCICCSLVGDFGKALFQVIEQYHPDRILIEPSGVGKLSDVRTAAEQVLSDEVQIGNLVTVADAGKCRSYMKNFGEFYNDQIETAGTVILSRTDTVPETKLEQAAALIREKNPCAAIITTPWSQLTGLQILQTMEEGNTMLQELEADHHGHCGHHEHDAHCGCHEHDHSHQHHEHGAHCGCHEHDHSHQHHEHGAHCGCHEHDHSHQHHEHGAHCGCHEHDHHAEDVFSSWGMETPKKFDEGDIRAILAAFDAGTAGTILRAKGIVPSTDGLWIHFDYTPGEHNIRRGTAGVTGRLCVIGSHMDEARLPTLFGL